MRYLFLFSFALPSEEDAPVLNMAFVLDAHATARMGLVSPDTYSEAFSDWLSEQASVFEEKFNAVHDFSGTNDDDVLVEGFCTYEIETPEIAAELMERWRQAFVDHIGPEGISAIVQWPESQWQEAAPSELAANVSSATPSSKAPFPR
jgi:hypothetical protein